MLLKFSFRLLFLWLVAFHAQVARAHHVKIHEKITKSAIEASPCVSSFLSNQSYADGTVFAYTIPDAAGDASVFLSLSAAKWIVEGVGWEDEEHVYAPGSWLATRLGEANGYRFINHFYDPYPEPGARLTDSSELPSSLFISGGYNSFQWGSTRNIRFTNLIIGTFPNIYSWQNARDYEYDALTNGNSVFRKEAMAKMFFSLGHVVHLIQDLSQPGHVRNDNHAKKRFIENYGQRNADSLIFAPLSLDWRAAGFTKLKDFWDRNLYTGNAQALNNDAANVAGSTLGLAEFTNGNLLSEDALYGDTLHPLGQIGGVGLPHYYPLPLLHTSTNFSQVVSNPSAHTHNVTLPNGTVEKRLTFAKTSDGISMENHCTLTYFGFEAAKRLGSYTTLGLSINDDLVLQNYHEVMLPKAIAYSAGCLDYFFRGKLGVLVWRKPGEHVFKLAVSNTSGGPLVGGKFELYWDDAAGNRTKIKEWPNALLPSWNTGDPATHVYSIAAFDKPPGLAARSFLVVYQGTINATATAPADPVDQGMAVAAVRFAPPLHCYEPASIAFSGVAPGPRTTSFPLNASFALTEVVPEQIDPSEPPTGLPWYSFKSGEFAVTYEYEDQDGVTQTGNSTGRAYVYPNPNELQHEWRAYVPAAFGNYLFPSWTPPPVELPGNRLQLENLQPPGDGADAPSASGGHAVITFR